MAGGRAAFFPQAAPGRPECDRISSALSPQGRSGGTPAETAVFYPLFVYRTDGAEYRWSVLSLINRQGPESTAVGPGDASNRGLDVWPVYFSRDTRSPDTSYHALFPIFGTVKYRFYVDRSTWVLFPLYCTRRTRGRS